MVQLCVKGMVQLCLTSVVQLCLAGVVQLCLAGGALPSPIYNLHNGPEVKATPEGAQCKRKEKGIFMSTSPVRVLFEATQNGNISFKKKKFSNEDAPV